MASVFTLHPAETVGLLQFTPTFDCSLRILARIQGNDDNALPRYCPIIYRLTSRLGAARDIGKDHQLRRHFRRGSSISDVRWTGMTNSSDDNGSFVAVNRQCLAARSKKA